MDSTILNVFKMSKEHNMLNLMVYNSFLKYGIIKDESNI